MKIVEANKLPLRPAMDVIVSVDETPDKATAVSATNIMTAYEGNANVIDAGAVVTLMDLCNGGVVNNGQARPIQTGSLPSGSKYGYIASELCGADGTFTNVPTVTISADDEWDYLTLMLYDSKGNYTQKVVSYPTWSSGSTVVPIETFTPNERLHIAKVSLGKAWQFDNRSLVEMDVELRGVNQHIEDGTNELEGSEIDLTAYVGADGDKWIDIFSRMQKYAAISFAAGYTDDMCDVRKFYLTECEYDSHNKTLRIRGCDATIAFMDRDFYGKYVPSTKANVRQNYFDTIREMILDCGIVPEESGEVPSGTGTASADLFFEKESRRQIISRSCGMYTDPDEFAITYRDGGIPELIAGTVDTTWEIDEEDVADFTTEIEMNVRSFETDLFTYSVSNTVEEVASQTEAIAGESYILEASAPFYSITGVTSDNGGAGTATAITPYTLKLVCTRSGNLSVQGYLIKKNTKASDNPRVVTDTNQRGITVELEERMKIVSDDEVTINALQRMLDVSNLKYKFKWRGNPHMKTQDLIKMKRTSTGVRFPEEYLYPSEEIYPKGGADIMMRITSISLEFEQGGGLISEIEARRCS
jgi:hypothetical protein